MEKMTVLPKKKQSREKILEALRKHHDQDSNWHDGRTWSLVYHAGDEHTDFLKEAYSIYFHQNGLNPGAFPSLKKYEAEVLAVSADLFGGGTEAAGTMTSGGSESLMMAVKTCRDWARATKPEIQQPEMIVPASIHPAVDKAAHYFSVKLIKAPIGADYRVDVKAVEKLITPNTILLMGSAPQYPQGVMDPIEDLAKLASSRGLWMHVDACIGGFFLPFVRKLGFPVPAFDFSVPGVTSISADLHKYGFSAKGASIILYRNKDYRRHQFFVLEGWSGGLFASPSMTGTRPAGSIAAAWATLMALGEEGYLEAFQGMMETTRKIQTAVRDMGLQILGNPVGPIFAIASDQIDVFAVADQMEQRGGWHIDRQQLPNCLHLTVTPAHEPVLEIFLKHLSESVEHVKAHPELSGQGKAAMYGMMAKIPDPRMVTQFLYQYMDERYVP